MDRERSGTAPGDEQVKEKYGANEKIRKTGGSIFDGGASDQWKTASGDTTASVESGSGPAGGIP